MSDDLMVMLGDLMSMVRHIAERSAVTEELVIGTPGKGQVTVKVDWSKEDEAHNRIAAALRQRMFAIEQMKTDDLQLNGA